MGYWKMESSNSKPERIFWVDLIRIVSIFLVVEIHASDIVVGQWGKSPFRYNISLVSFFSAEAWASLARMSIPLLFMISGYLLLASNDELWIFIKKRFWKVIIPLLAWSLIDFWMTGYYNNMTSLFQVIKSSIKGILAGNVYFTLWFLYALIPLYMVTPLFRRIAQLSSSKEMWYLAILWGIATIVHTIGRIKGWNLGLLTQDYFAGYAGYFFLGYFLGRCDQGNKVVWLSAILFPLTIAVVAYWAYMMADHGRIDTELIFDYLSLQTAVITVTGFILLKKLGIIWSSKISEPAKKVILFFSTTSFGIYFVHTPIVTTLLQNMFGFIPAYAKTLLPLIGIPFITTVVFLISAVLAFVLQKIPILKRIVPA